MNLPGLKMRRRRPGASPEPEDDYTKIGWYVMAALAVAWMAYKLFFDK